MDVEQKRWKIATSMRDHSGGAKLGSFGTHMGKLMVALQIVWIS